MRLLIVIFLFLSTCLAHAQVRDAKAEFAILSKKYSGEKPLELSMHYRLFANHSIQIAAESYPAQLLIYRNNSVFTVGGIKNIKLHNVYMEIDSADQSIVYSKQNIKKNTQVIMLTLDSLMKYFIAGPVKPLSNNGFKVSLFPNTAKYGDNDIEKMEIYYTNTYQILRTVIFYETEMDINNEGKIGQPPRIEVSYSSLKPLPSKLLPLLHESYYVFSRKGKIMPSANFKDFKVIDTRYTN
jgi:hypothetical protein